MSYISVGAKVNDLTIGGTSYKNRLVSWQADDSSGIKTGMVITTGQVTLGPEVDGQGTNYERKGFRRGDEVVLTMKKLDGSIVRHPRGLLYVVSSVYDNGTGQVVIELGCDLALRALTDTYEDLLSDVPVPLDPDRNNFQAIGAAYATAGKYLYMDNNGVLRSQLFFEGDSESVSASGLWTSVMGYTTAEVAPLSGANPLPDEIKLSYQQPEGADALDSPTTERTTTTQSTYFINYPGTVKVRVPAEEGIPADSAQSSATVPSGGYATGCGGSTPSNGRSTVASGVNEGNQPAGNCSSNYITEDTQVFVQGTRSQTSKSHYKAIGNQISLEETESYITSVDINSQYYADRYAYCQASFGSACDPSGGCPLFGTSTVTKDSFSRRVYTYAEDGSLLETVEDSYRTLLSAASSNDWRTGVVDGVPQQFREIDDTVMYHDRRVITTNSREGSEDVVRTVIKESPVAYTDGIGYKSGDNLYQIAQKLSALNGRVTFSERRSSSNSTAPDRTDTTARTSTAVVDRESIIPVFDNTHTTPPNTSGPYQIQESVPVPFLYSTPEDIATALYVYSIYISKGVKGDSLGLSVSEMLRDDVIDNWTPSCPFRFADTQEDKIIALRMDSTSWTTDGGFAAFSTNALWIGISNGTVELPVNVTGNSSPIFVPEGSPPGTEPPATPALPPGTSVAPSIAGETYVDSGIVGFVVNVFLNLSSTCIPLGSADGVVGAIDVTETINSVETTMCYCSGLVIEAGGLLNTTFSGSVAISAGGSLLTDEAIIVNSDVFTA